MEVSQEKLIVFESILGEITGRTFAGILREILVEIPGHITGVIPEGSSSTISAGIPREGIPKRHSWKKT